MDRSKSRTSAAKPSSRASAKPAKSQKSGSKTTASRSAASRPAASRAAASSRVSAAKSKVATVKSSGQPLSARVNTPAKLARRTELCGSLPGGVDAYYYQDRCNLKAKLDGLMQKNRRAAAFTNKVLLEMPVIEKLMHGAEPSQADLKMVFNDPLAVEAAVRVMTDPAYMESHPQPADRYNAAVAKLSRTYPNIAKKPDAYKKMVMRQTYNVFYASAQNVQKFKGRPATNKVK